MNEYKRLTMRQGGKIKLRPEVQMYPRDLIDVLVGRLEMYEDIGSPEEFAELAKAKVEGRIIELPCKVGDVLYAENPYGKAGFVPKEKHIEKWRVTHVGITIESGGWGKHIDFNNFGKTVFLTREEAESALKQIGGGQDG